MYKNVAYLSPCAPACARRVSACLAGALVAMQCQLDKLNPVIRPLMEVVKRERNSSMQVREWGASSCMGLLSA